MTNKKILQFIDFRIEQLMEYVLQGKFDFPDQRACAVEQIGALEDIKNFIERKEQYAKTK